MNPFALGVLYSFPSYTRINMTSGTILHKYLRSSIHDKNKETNSPDDSTVNT